MERKKFVNMIEFDEGGRIVNFNVPVQVKFWDEEGEFYRAGIGYNDCVICACCGGVIPINEIYEAGATYADGQEPIIPYEDWSDLTDSILLVDGYSRRDSHLNFSRNFKF